MAATKCRRWQTINGKRAVCQLEPWHRQECQPHARVRLAARLDELARLLSDHDQPDVMCPPCQSANAFIRAGNDPEQAVDLKCEWYLQSVASAIAGSAELARLDLEMGVTAS